MQHSATNYDKVLKPVSRAAEALKRDKQIKREYTDVFRQLDKLDSAVDNINDFKAVVDEKSFDQKLKLLLALQKASTNVTDLIKEHAKGSGAKPVFDDLVKAMKAFNDQVDDSLKEFKNWFKKSAEAGECEINLPRNITDMIELAQARGRINMPSDQSFDATIKLKYKSVPDLGNVLSENAREFIGEAGRALEPLKKETADAFKGWQSKYYDIEQEFDKDAADDLFKTINNWFDKDIRPLIKTALEKAMKKAVEDICSKDNRFKDSAGKVSIEVLPDYKNFAEFVFKLPENPADETSKALGKGIENLESTQKEYKEAVDSIVENHESVDTALQSVQKKLEDSQKKGGDGQSKFDLSKELDELNKETTELETALKDARKVSAAFAKDLDDVKKKVDSSKGALKSNATIDKASFDQLGKVLGESQTALKKQIPDQLTKLDGLVKLIKKQHEAITALGGRDKAPPKAEDLKRSKDALVSVGKDFQKEKANLAKNLKLPDGADKLKSLVDKLKT